MRVLICSSFVPFVDGGGRFICDWLDKSLRRCGIASEVVYLPFVEDPQTILEQMLMYRLMDLSNSTDRIIAIRPPTYLLRHHDKILWFIHHIRVFYDLWETEYRQVPDTPAGRALRDRIVEADTQALLEARRIYSNSRIVADRLLKYNGIASEVLYPPLFEPDRFRCGDWGDYILLVCRIEHHKRQHLLIEAMCHVQTSVRLMLCGVSTNVSYERSLLEMIEQKGLSDRVVFAATWITEDRKADLLADCLAAAYVPFDEDSYGYPSIEAHHAKKGVVTCKDSGGTLELVTHKDNGLVVEPEPESLAIAFDQLYSDRKLARSLGLRGHERLQELGINWDRVVEVFTS